MTGSRLPGISNPPSSDPPLSFGTPKQLGNGKLHGRPFENIEKWINHKISVWNNWIWIIFLILHVNVHRFNFSVFALVQEIKYGIISIILLLCIMKIFYSHWTNEFDFAILSFVLFLRAVKYFLMHFTLTVELKSTCKSLTFITADNKPNRI